MPFTWTGFAVLLLVGTLSASVALVVEYSIVTLSDTRRHLHTDVFDIPASTVASVTASADTCLAASTVASVTASADTFVPASTVACLAASTVASVTASAVLIAHRTVTVAVSSLPLLLLALLLLPCLSYFLDCFFSAVRDGFIQVLMNIFDNEFLSLYSIHIMSAVLLAGASSYLVDR